MPAAYSDRQIMPDRSVAYYKQRIREMLIKKGIVTGWSDGDIRYRPYDLRRALVVFENKLSTADGYWHAVAAANEIEAEIKTQKKEDKIEIQLCKEGLFGPQKSIKGCISSKGHDTL